MDFRNIRDLFLYQVTNRCNNTFLIFPETGKKYSYKDVDDITDKLAAFFIDKGLKKENIIAVFLDNSPEIIFMYIACFKIGITILPVDPYFSKEKVEYVLDTAKPAFVVIGGDFYDKYISLLFDRNIDFIVDGNNKTQDVISIAEISKGKKVMIDFNSINICKENVATLVFTSGTTGEPKGVPLKHGHFLCNIHVVSDWLKLDSNDNFLCITPLYYNHGYYNSMLFVLYIGGTLTVTKNFDIFIASNYWRYVADYGVTVLSIVPPIAETLNRLFDKGLQKYDFSKVRFAVCGTAPLRIASLEKFEKIFGIKIIRQYGLIETLLIVWDDLDVRKRRLRSTGKAVAGKIYIIGEHNNKLGPGKEGEVVIEAKSVIDGYFNNDRLTKAAIRNGLFFTGDVGFLDEDGYLYLYGRKDDMINKGGSKISPAEIEEVINSCEPVKEAAAIGVPDEIYGEDLLCFVVKETDDISDKDFIDTVQKFCARNLESHWRPTKFRIVNNIPKGPTGKVLRKELVKFLE